MAPPWDPPKVVPELPILEIRSADPVVRVRTLWKVYLPPTPFLPGARSSQNQKSKKNSRFYKVYQPKPSKTTYAKGGGSSRN